MCDIAEKIYGQGIEQGEAKGRIEEAKATASRMYEKGYRVAIIADMLNRSENQISEWLGLALA